MNSELIKELMKEANLQPYYEGQEKDIENFAELIVKECINIIDPKEDPYSFSLDTYGRNASKITIKKHFGIE